MIEGFFTSKEIECRSFPGGKKFTCNTCGLYKTAITPKIQPVGNFRKRILNIGSTPSEIEDKLGTYWSGRAGRKLEKVYRRLGVDLWEDCLNINACHCRVKNRLPSQEEISSCRKFNLQLIEKYQPHVVVLFGESALSSIIGHRWKRDLGTIHKWRGFAIPDQDFHCWICPTFHPQYIVNSKEGAGDVIWANDLEQAMGLLNQPVPKHKKPKIEYLDDLSLLEEIYSGIITIDYETTGIKPHATGHRIVCCAVALNEDFVYVFMMPKSRKKRQPLVDLLANKNVLKVAHNIKFEEAWSRVRLRQPVKGWVHDTMLCAHVLDNRPGITNLKIQTYLNFGIVDYASEITLYLMSVDGSSNGLNRIDHLLTLPNGDRKLMKYCALDAIYEYRLYKRQEQAMLPF